MVSLLIICEIILTLTYYFQINTDSNMASKEDGPGVNHEDSFTSILPDDLIQGNRQNENSQSCLSAMEIEEIKELKVTFFCNILYIY